MVEIYIKHIILRLKKEKETIAGKRIISQFC